MIQQLQVLEPIAIASRVVAKNTNILELELRDQLERRKESGSNEPIGGYTSSYYVNWKWKRPTKSKFFNGVTVDLFLTGQWQQSITASVENDMYRIDATDFKTPFLQAMYGDEILAFSDTSKENLREVLTPIFQEELKKEMLK